jgi:hypothetical protein
MGPTVFYLREDEGRSVPELWPHMGRKSNIYGKDQSAYVREIQNVIRSAETNPMFRVTNKIWSFAMNFVARLQIIACRRSNPT